MIAILREETLGEELAPIQPQTIDAVLVLGRVCSVQAILLVVTPKREVAVLVREGIVAVLAILRLFIDDGKSRATIEEHFQLFDKRLPLFVRLSEI